ncbi:MAG: protein kinase [Melioribacteraceae bacterium]|nr:protein kinase [Melioribacteraceae bacterium]
MKKFIFFILVLIFSCNQNENINVETNQPAKIWFKQANVDLGAQIEMIDSENGFAISRGKGDKVKGVVYQFEKGSWKEISSHDYSDYPLLKAKDKNLIYWITHSTHRGDYKPQFIKYNFKTKKEIILPKIMWDDSDYSMWTGISIIREDKIWLAGQQGNIIHFDGVKWVIDENNYKRKPNENFSAGDLHDIQMLNENLGWAVGKQGLILKYENGNWKKYNSPTNDELNKISMLDENFGWIVGDKGTILKFENNQWKKIENIFRVKFNSVKTLSKDKAWIVGARSTLVELINNEWIEDKSIKIFEDNFTDIDIINKENENKIWIIGDNGIYTNSQNLKFSFTDVTSNLSLRKEGRAGIFRDYNNDGFLDLAVMLEDSPTLIYRNQNGNFFSEVDRDFLSANIFSSQSIASADFDNDNNIDLLEILDDVNNNLSFGKGNFEFRNVDTRKFINLNYIQTDLNLANAQVADFDNDGNLDIYFSNYNNDDMIFKNNGVGKFENVFGDCGIKKLKNHRAYGVTLTDFNNDNLIDVLITYKLAEKNQHIFLYLNKGNFKFEEKTDKNFYTNFAPSTYSSIENDFNNDGFTDIIVFNNESELKFLINDGNANFKDVADEIGLSKKFFHPEPSGGIMAAADVNNDGWLDIFIGSELYLNSPEFFFTEVSKSVGIDFIGNPSFADFDNDGDIDLFIGSSREALGKGDRAVLYKNNSNEKNFITVKLNADVSNRNAIGAKVYLLGYNNDSLVYKTIRQVGLGSNSVAQENFSKINFGINPNYNYKIKVVFPSGTIKIVDVEKNKLNEINESTFLEKELILTKKSLTRTLLLIDYKVEVVKFILVFILLIIAFVFGLKTKAKKVVYHLYFGLFWIFIYLALVHLTITSQIILSWIIPIGVTSGLAFSFIYIANKIIEKRESNYISHYKILELIGSGGMGKVYKALDTQTSKIVAIKILNPEILKAQENKKRLAGEGILLSSLQNKNIIKIFEYGETEKCSFISMEYLSGGTLQEYIEKNYPITNKKIIEIALQICNGLKEIHNQKIIHRDLKSSNVMFDDKNEIRIMDFGLSKSPLVTTMTTLGTVIGTLGYVAPEQITNFNVDKRTDIFSFGVILYQLATGKLPFTGENEIALIHTIFNTEPIKPSVINKDLNKEIEKIILKCIRKNPEERFSNVEEIIIELLKIPD